MWKLIVCGAVLGGVLHGQSPRRTVSFDADWRFYQGDVLNGQGVQTEDAAWKSVSVPHDWAIAGPIRQDAHTGGAGGFAPSGVSWYRKHFRIPQADAGKHVFLEFDGVMAHSDVWINGVSLGHRPNGYVSFRYELTSNLHYGNAENIVAVRTDTHLQPASRWYQGAGIYRHVRLVVEDATHLQPWSVFVTTPQVSASKAAVVVKAEVIDQARNSNAVVRVSLLSPTGEIVAKGQSSQQALQRDQDTKFEVTMQVASPRLWDIESPTLYRAHVEVLKKGTVVDEETVPFGIREFHFDAATGFWLNGRNLKIKGVALHSDGGAVGMAVPLTVWRHRLEAMKHMGANAIRTAHNPVAPEFLDLCDQMGFLVMDEFFDQWTVAKNPYDYHLDFKQWSQRDLEDTVRRDRNHPSIILYSAGNEIRDTPHPEIAKPILSSLVAAYHATDPTRPVTQALFRPNVSHDYTNGLADLLDVVGQNYRTNELLDAHAQKPSRKIIGTENIHDLASWLALRDNPQYSGMFIWAGTDYLGESRRWPLIGDSEGLFDRTDAPKPDALERESWWADHPVLYMVRRTAPTEAAPTDPGYESEQYRPKQVQFHDWSPRDRSAHEEKVEVYSNCDDVELFLNGRSLGSKPRNGNDSPRVWTVSFEQGEIVGVGRNKGREVMRETLRSAGAASKIALHVEEKHLGEGFDDVAYLRAEVQDANGTVVPSARNPITFQVEGAGEILGTDNGDYVYESPFPNPTRTAMHGTAIVIVRARAPHGELVVRAATPGLEGAAIRLRY